MQEYLTVELTDIQNAGLTRQPRTIDACNASTITINGTNLINFCSNDYLGLRRHPVLIEAAKEALERYGLGAGSSRLISGNLALHDKLEQSIARFKDYPAALAFTSGYAANVGTISALVDKQDLIIIDKLCHASIIDGCKLSGAKLRIFPHMDLKYLKKILNKERTQRNCLIITESVFSMDGDQADLPELVEIKDHYRAWLMVDEAHATGVFGEHGRGLINAHDLQGKVDIVMGTLSKALGSQGGFICGSTELKSYLVNRCRSFIYSTGLDCAAVAGAIAAIDLIMQDDSLRLKLWENVRYLQQCATEKGVKLISSAQIVPYIVGSNAEALAQAHKLFEQDIYVSAIRYPTVAKGTERLRITLSAMHTREQISAITKVITSF